MLNHRTLGSGPDLFILHGIFGSLENWRTFGSQLSSRFRVHLVDLRNHGESFHSDRFDYESMVEDVTRLMEAKGVALAHFIGHSMGGKLAMHFALQQPEKIKKLVVVDMTPLAYPGKLDHIYDALEKFDTQDISSRSDAVGKLSQLIPNQATCLFLLKNLARDSGEKYYWKVNLPALLKNREKIFDEVRSHRTHRGEVLFVRGELSDYIPKNFASVLFPAARVETVKGAGHWVHASHPDELLSITMTFLSQTRTASFGD